MYMKVFPHGSGRGDKAVNYVIAPNRKGREDNPPTVLRGDPQTVRQVIDSTARKWKYTSGVLSWAPEDAITKDMGKRIMDSFESFAFAGLQPDQYSVLWVRHNHNAHHELHFIIPRTELHQEKAFNPCPPGWQKQYDVWRDLWNEKEQWARPDDPKRARLIQPGKAVQFKTRNEKATFRESITKALAEGIASGLHSCRDDLIHALKESGFEIPRKGKNYITIKPEKSDERIRLKGGIYAKSWGVDQAIAREHEKSGSRNRRNHAERIAKLQQEHDAIRRKRAEYCQNRYGSPGRAANGRVAGFPYNTVEALPFDMPRSTGSLRSGLRSHGDAGRIAHTVGAERDDGFSSKGDETGKPHPGIETNTPETSNLGAATDGVRRSSVHRPAQNNAHQNRKDERWPERHNIGGVNDGTETPPRRGNQSNGKGTQNPVIRPGNSNEDLGNRRSRLPRLAERIGRLVGQTRTVVERLAKLTRQWTKLLRRRKNSQSLDM